MAQVHQSVGFLAPREATRIWEAGMGEASPGLGPTPRHPRPGSSSLPLLLGQEGQGRTWTSTESRSQALPAEPSQRWAGSMEGQMETDGQMGGGQAHKTVEVNLFFPQLALLLDSGHSHTGYPKRHVQRGEKNREKGVSVLNPGHLRTLPGS